MNDEVKEAIAECRNAVHLGNVGIQFRNTVVDAYLAELDETPISGDLLIPFGFTYWEGTWSIGLSDTSELYWIPPSGEDSWNGVRGLFILASDPTDRPEGFSHLPTPYTMGQVHTLLRVFGVKGGEKK